MSTINPIKYIHYERRVWHGGGYVYPMYDDDGLLWRYVRTETSTDPLIGIGTFDLMERWEEADNGEVLQG
jgi:hypothetical protein